MIWFKSCHRCKRGDMTFDEDGDRLCLQCGHIQRSVSAAMGASSGYLDAGRTMTPGDIVSLRLIHVEAKNA